MAAIGVDSVIFGLQALVGSLMMLTVFVVAVVLTVRSWRREKKDLHGRQ